jgi:hypothetical protein
MKPIGEVAQELAQADRNGSASFHWEQSRPYPSAWVP